jgi:hypothetical protein
MSSNEHRVLRAGERKDEAKVELSVKVVDCEGEPTAINPSLCRDLF